jgi:hypothetical protein
MIHCICIKFGAKYNSEYVNKLFRGIKRNTTKEFLFTCFTDNSDGLDSAIEIKSLPLVRNDLFAKIGLYNKELYNENDQIFYFDLDTVIVGLLDEIFEYSGDFMILRDFYRRNGFGSGLMSWRPHAVDHMAKNYRGQRCAHGDQGWPEQQYPGADIWQKQYPEKVISYKVHVQNKGRNRPGWTQHGGSLQTASIVCFHGRPMPHDVANLDWMQENWK